MNEHRENPELLQISPDAKTRIAQTIEKSLQSAVRKAEESESLFGLPPEVSTAFDIGKFSKSHEDSATDPNRELLKTYQPDEYGYFIVNAGNTRLEIKGSLEDIRKGNFTCSQIWINGKSLYISISKYENKITITQHARAGEDLIKAAFKALLGNEMEGEAKLIVEDHDIFLSDAYKELPDLIERNVNLQEAYMTSGRLMNVAEGVRYMRILEEIYKSGMPLERGVSRLEYPVMTDTEYVNAYNPDGLYIAHTIHSKFGILDTREVPVPLVDKTGKVVGWTVAHLYYDYSPSDPTRLKEERIKFENDSDFVMEYENELKPLRERYANEKKAVQVATAYLEDFFDGLNPNLNIVEEAFAQLDEELSQEALKEIKGTIEFSESNKAFVMLAESIVNEFRLVFPEMANKAYLPDFVSRYLAYKIYTGQLQEDDVRERIRTQGSFIWFDNLSGCLKYLISQRGTRRILIDG